MNEHEKRARDVVERVILVQKVFGSEDGQKLLHDFLKKFHYFSPSFSKDPYETAFKEGERNVLNFILTQLQRDPAKELDIVLKQFKEEKYYEA